MLFNVPQFINIEDKIVGPLTGKQLGWLALGGIVILFLWAILESLPFYVCSFVTALVFCALAFYKPYNQPLINFIFSSINFVFRPRMYVWKRLPDNAKMFARGSEKVTQLRNRKEITEQKIREISEVVDWKNNGGIGKSPPATGQKEDFGQKEKNILEVRDIKKAAPPKIESRVGDNLTDLNQNSSGAPSPNFSGSPDPEEEGKIIVLRDIKKP